ncbi:MAG: efflux RND transporter permease subunit, partial [Pseudomonadales bacterium]|nr:efflux RND transporter permease subunit [Pseudomonadales bacterium]
MIAWFTRNSVAANLLMFTIIMGGILAFYQTVSVELFPTSEPETVTISVALRGATPEDIELGVAVRIEEAIHDLEGIEKLTSHSREGATSTIIEIERGYDAREMLSDIKSRIDAINTFPADAEKPVISLQQFNFPVIDVVVSGDAGEDEIQFYAEQVREDILRLGDVSQVELRLVREYEVSIEIAQDTLRNYGLTLERVARSVQEASLDVSAGNVRTEGGDILIRSKGQAYHRDDFATIVVGSNADGSVITLGEVAHIDDGFSESGLESDFDGKSSAFVSVSRVGSQSVIQIAKKVKNYIEEQQALLPRGISLSYWDDDSAYLKNRIETLVRNMLQGGVLVVILLAVFLRPAVAFWVVIGIPISFIGCFMVLGAVGITINMMSVFGFILVLGLVVDDAIVTGESIYARLETGESGVEAATRGAQRVAIPVTFGVLTTIAAFSPLAFMEGFLGRVIAPLPVVVASVLFISLIETKFILPAHLKHLKPLDPNKANKGWRRWQYKISNGFEGAILTHYGPILLGALRNRYAVLAGFLGVFAVIVALLSSGWIRFTFMPRVPAETVVASVTMPVGTPFEVTDRHITKIAEHARALQERYTNGRGESAIKHILAVTGSQRSGNTGPHLGQVAIEMYPLEKRPVALESHDLSKEMRKLIGVIPGAEELAFRSEIFSTGSPVHVQLRGNSFERLSDVASQIKDRLRTYPTVFDIRDSYFQGKQELNVELSDEGRVLGLTRAGLLSQISQAFQGFEAQRIQRGRDDVRVLVRLPRSERGTLATLDSMLINLPSGQQAPLSHLAALKPATGPAQITRIDRYRVVDVTADFDKGETNAVALTADIEAYVQNVLANYPDITYTLEGEAREQRDTTSSLGVSLVALLFFIYCMLALPLRSYFLPVVVMSVIPFALVGAVLGHVIMGHDMTMLSYMGLMALVGVV